MKLSLFLKDKSGSILLHLSCMLVAGLFLFLIGNSSSDIILFLLTWLIIVCIYYGTLYIRRKRYFNHMMNVLDELDMKYLIAEVLRPGNRLEDQLFFDILRMSNKSVQDRIKEMEQQQDEYKEYLESWIHEVKTPLTSMELICENNKNESMQKIKEELAKLENQVDMVLYYARSEQAYQDYMIHEVSLKDIVISCIQKNKPYFMQHHFQIQMDVPDIKLSTDEKWAAFLMNQIFINAIKYCQPKTPILQLKCVQEEKSVSLVIEDNGIGIPPEDQKRVFDKGFTGKNGRQGKKSTGMGLYLCKRICEKLDIGICLESQEKVYTRVILTFPYSNQLKILQK